MEGAEKRTDPGVAQLVARVVWDHQAAGSNPVTRTRNKGDPAGGPPLFLVWAAGRQSLLARSAAAATDDAQRHPSPFREFEPCHSDQKAGAP